MMAMSELRPAKDREKKKTMAKNRPPLMLPNRRGILDDVYSNYCDVLQCVV